MSTSKQTTAHETIKKWATERDGVPAKVKGTGGANDDGILRIHFPSHSDSDDLQQISWDEFFQEFDEKNLNFLYQEEKENGEQSTFHKFVKG